MQQCLPRHQFCRRFAPRRSRGPPPPRSQAGGSSNHSYYGKYYQSYIQQEEDRKVAAHAINYRPGISWPIPCEGNFIQGVHGSQSSTVVLPNPFTLVHVLGGICNEFLQPWQVRENSHMIPARHCLRLRKICTPTYNISYDYNLL